MKKLLYSLCAALLALVAASCDSNPEPASWQPAEPLTSAGIFFTNTDNILSVTVGEDTHVSIPVRRLDTEGELTVPLLVTVGNPNLSVPQSVSFADGEEDSEIVIDLSTIPTKEQISLVITFPDEYVNPYAAGSAVFDGAVLVSDWEPVTDGPVLFQWFDWSYAPSTVFDPVESEMLHLPGTNRYRIINFLNSGVDFTFDLQASTYTNWVGYSRIMPMGNQVLYSEYEWEGYYNPWWLVDDLTGEWPELTLTCNSREVMVYGSSFMWYDDESANEFCYMRLAGTTDMYGNVATKNFGYMAFYGFYEEEWDWSAYTGYLRVYFEFPAQ